MKKRGEMIDELRHKLSEVMAGITPADDDVPPPPPPKE